MLLSKGCYYEKTTGALRLTAVGSQRPPAQHFQDHGVLESSMTALCGLLVARLSFYLLDHMLEYICITPTSEYTHACLNF